MKPVWMFVGLGFAGLLTVLAVTPWTLKGAGRRAVLVAAISRDIGLDVRIRGPVTVKLLPRPRVQITDLTATTPDGAVALTAPTLSATIDLSVLVGSPWRIVSATVSNPTAVIDLDRATSPRMGPDPTSSPARLSVRAGVVRLVSAATGLDTVATDINGSIERQSSGGQVAAHANAVLRGIGTQFTLRLGAPLGITTPQREIALKIGSAAGSLSASGRLVGGALPQFSGDVSAASSAPGRLLAALGLRSFWADTKRVALTGKAVARRGDVSLSDASLTINGARFDGTLGYHADRQRGLVEGTLATGELDVQALIGRDLDPPLLRRLYTAEVAPHLADTDLDLRISANSVAFGETKVQDVALSVLCHDRRLDLNLDEAVAFGGVLKAHVSGSVEPRDIEAHAEVALSGLDLGALGVALTGEQRMTGLLTGTVDVDSAGRSLSEIVPRLAGRGEVSVENGEFLGLSVSQALKRFTRRLPFGVAQPGQLTAFASASSTMRIDGGMVNFVDGKVSGPGVSLAFAGRGDLPNGKVDILALASPTDAAGTPIAGAAGLPFEMRGAWGEPLLVTDHSRLSFPGFAVPDLAVDQLLP